MFRHVLPPIGARTSYLNWRSEPRELSAEFVFHCPGLQHDGKEESESAVETARGRRRKRSKKVNMKEQERGVGRKRQGDRCMYIHSYIGHPREKEELVVDFYYRHS